MQTDGIIQHPQFGPVRLSAAATGDRPDDQVYDTVAAMIRHAQADSRDPAVIRLAEWLTVPGNPRATLSNIWNWTASHLEFRLDADLLQPIPGATDYSGSDYGVECLIPPAQMLYAVQTRGKGYGDCDDYTMLVCALVLACGIPCSIVTIASRTGPEPAAYSHVYAVAYPEGLPRIAMDASHGAYFGWEAPANEVSRLQEWSVGANGPGPSVGYVTALVVGLGLYLMGKRKGRR